MDAAGRHAIFTGIGFVLGCVVVWLMQPPDATGVGFYVGAMVILMNLAAAAWSALRPKRVPQVPKKALAWLVAAAAVGSQVSCAPPSLVPHYVIAPEVSPMAPPAPPAPPMPSHGTGPANFASGGSAGPARDITPSRAFLRGRDIPPPGVAGYGVVAVPALTAPAHLKMACTAYLASLPTQESLAGAVAVADQMVTVWPLAHPTAPQARGTDTLNGKDCDFFDADYDLYGGIAAIRDARRQGYRLTGPGPFLIGWSPASSRGVPNTVVLVLDMSSLHVQASFDAMFLFWQRKVVEDPSLWRNGFSVEKLRIAMNDFAEGYGPEVIKGIKF